MYLSKAAGRQRQYMANISFIRKADTIERSMISVSRKL